MALTSTAVALAKLARRQPDVATVEDLIHRFSLHDTEKAGVKTAARKFGVDSAAVHLTRAAVAELHSFMTAMMSDAFRQAFSPAMSVTEVAERVEMDGTLWSTAPIGAVRLVVDAVTVKEATSGDDPTNDKLLVVLEHMGFPRSPPPGLKQCMRFTTPHPDYYVLIHPDPDLEATDTAGAVYLGMDATVDISPVYHAYDHLGDAARTALELHSELRKRHSLRLTGPDGDIIDLDDVVVGVGVRVLGVAPNKLPTWLVWITTDGERAGSALKVEADGLVHHAVTVVHTLRGETWAIDWNGDRFGTAGFGWISRLPLSTGVPAGWERVAGGVDRIEDDAGRQRVLAMCRS